MQHLMKVAARLRVRVHVVHLDDPEVVGAYDHDNRRIYLSYDLTPFEMRSVLAHELAHAYFGDECSNGRNETRADRIAAEMLIDPVEYARAEAVDPSSAAIAEELEVTENVVDDYRRYCVQRLGDRTYGISVRSRLRGDLAARLSASD